jgi:hypothetical protein
MEVFLIAAVLRQLLRRIRSYNYLERESFGYWTLVQYRDDAGLTFADNYRPSQPHEFEPELAVILPRHRAAVVMAIIALNAGKTSPIV